MSGKRNLYSSALCGTYAFLAAHGWVWRVRRGIQYLGACVLRGEILFAFEQHLLPHSADILLTSFGNLASILVFCWSKSFL